MFICNKIKFYNTGKAEVGKTILTQNGHEVQKVFVKLLRKINV